MIYKLGMVEKENTSPTETVFLDLHLYINGDQIQRSLYDKRDSFNFNAAAVKFPYKRSIVLSKI